MIRSFVKSSIMRSSIRQAGPDDAAAVERLLVEAARWVDALGVVMWEEGELESAAIAAEVAAGQFYVAEIDGQIAGAVRYQEEDALFWPDLPTCDSAFVHRLVVSRAFKGRGVSEALLAWAVEHARARGKQALRLDCDANRQKLRDLYERVGFRFHSYRQVQSYYVSRYEFPLGPAGDS
jgi:ribosomal protein S18 acetylase RimI-like enzyme